MEVFKTKSYPEHEDIINDILIKSVRSLNTYAYLESGNFPDTKSICDLSQIFYVICLGVSNILPSWARMLVPTIEKAMASEIETAQAQLADIVDDILYDGASDKELTPYLYKVFVTVLGKQFPGETLLKLG